MATPEPAAIQQKRAQVAAIQAELAAIDAEVERAAEAYNGARYELGLVKERIAQNKRQIRGTVQDLKESERVLAGRLRDIYATPEPTLAEVIINSGSISAAADQIELLDQVGQQDASVVKTLEENKARLEALRAQLLIDQKKVEVAVEQTRQYKERVEGLLAQRAAVLENVKGELSQMIRAEEERQRQIAAQQAAIAQARQAAAAAAAAQGGTPGAPAAGGAAPAVATAPLPSGGGNSAAVAVAMQQLGTPYVWGGSGPGGFDCSGLASYAYGQAGKSVPHYTGAIWNQFPKVGNGQLAAGDMVFFNGGGHMGIYIGGGQYVHAPQTGDVVRVANLGERSDYMGAVRP
ncbi:MAG TPA: NlpC/P60 family protein [Miltoncostaeaceae bacterium]|nr:NlpC/P60 family protein [Miltoncostaeaceae bacterium]